MSGLRLTVHTFCEEKTSIDGIPVAVIRMCTIHITDPRITSVFPLPKLFDGNGKGEIINS